MNIVFYNLNENSFAKKLAAIAASLVILGKNSTLSNEKGYPNLTLSQASGKNGRTHYRSDDVEDQRHIYSVNAPVSFKDIIYPNYSKIEATAIYWFNQLLKLNKESSIFSGEFLYRLREALKVSDFDTFFQLIEQERSNFSDNFSSINFEF